MLLSASLVNKHSGTSSPARHISNISKGDRHPPEPLPITTLAPSTGAICSWELKKRTEIKDDGSKDERRRWKCQFCSFSTNSLETLQLHVIALHWDENLEEVAKQEGEMEQTVGDLTLPLVKVLQQSDCSQGPPHPLEKYKGNPHAHEPLLGPARPQGTAVGGPPPSSRFTRASPTIRRSWARARSQRALARSRETPH